eukprot:1196313-Prorocentrum_minimum.AAC.4
MGVPRDNPRILMTNFQVDLQAACPFCMSPSLTVPEAYDLAEASPIYVYDIVWLKIEVKRENPRAGSSSPFMMD